MHFFHCQSRYKMLQDFNLFGMFHIARAQGQISNCTRDQVNWYQTQQVCDR